MPNLSYGRNRQTEGNISDLLVSEENDCVEIVHDQSQQKNGTEKFEKGLSNIVIT